MITAEWLRKLSLWIWPRELLPWPTQWMNRWGAWLLFGGFLGHLPVGKAVGFAPSGLPLGLPAAGGGNYGRGGRSSSA